MTKMDDIKASVEKYVTPDVERAYEIDGKLYEGKIITQEEQDFFDKVVGDLFLKSLDKSNTDFPFGVRLWLLYTVKNLSQEWNEANNRGYRYED